MGDRIQVQLSLLQKSRWVEAVVDETSYSLVANWRWELLSGQVAINEGLKWRPITTDGVPAAVRGDATSGGKRKRYPGKGKACGWIETRRTNCKREKPSEYLVYRWQDGEGKHSRYLKKAIAPKVREMIDDGATVSQILAVIPSHQSNESKEV